MKKKSLTRGEKRERANHEKSAKIENVFRAMTQAFKKLHNFVFIFRSASQNYKRNV